MATRMQQRRGTAAQWTSANPILNAGEMGWESDTNKFKIGDGTNHWADLDYFIDQSSTVNPAFGSSITFEGATANAYETTLAVTDPTADRTITLPDASGTVALTSDITAIVDGAPGLLDTLNELAAAINDDANFASTITTEIATKLPKTGGNMTGSINMGSNSIVNLASPSVTGDAATKGYVDTTVSSYALIASPTFSGNVVLPLTTSIGNVSSTEISHLDGVTSPVQTQLDNKASSSHTHLLTAGATDVTASAAELNIMDGVTASTAEINILDGVTASTAEINILDGVTASTAELNYVDGVTSAIQTQLDSKSATGHSHTASDVTDFTEAAQDAVGNALGSGLSYNDSTGAISVDTTAIQAVVSGVSNTEIGYLDGVTSAIQTQLDNKLALAGGTMSGAIAMGTNKITGLGDPTADQDAATKAYVDAATAGLNVHASVKAATTANITLSSAVENGDTLDGVTLATGDRILIKNQTTKADNGIYTVNASGAPTRAVDYNTTPEVDAGDFVFVESGTVNGKTGWIQTNTVATIGTSDIEFTQFSGAGTYAAGTGLTLTGNTFAIDSTVTTDSGSKTLTNKTIALGSNTVSGTTAQFNSALTDGDFATLAGSETLTNKTLTSPTMTSPTVSSGALTVSATGITFTDGTQTKEGVPSRTTIVQQSASYNLSTGGLTLRDNLLELGSASAITLTIPANSTTAYPVGTAIDILQTGAGQVTVAGAAGVTVNATPGLKLRTQWSSATLFKRATDTWVVMGDLSA